jgi:hypothetical protein
MFSVRKGRKYILFFLATTSYGAPYGTPHCNPRQIDTHIAKPGNHFARYIPSF